MRRIITATGLFIVALLTPVLALVAIVSLTTATPVASKVECGPAPVITTDYSVGMWRFTEWQVCIENSRKSDVVPFTRQ
jgi:hypothetical protein